MSGKIDSLKEYIEKLAAQKFTGSLLIQFDNGYPNDLSEQRKFKTEDLPRIMRKAVYVIKKPEAEKQADGEAKEGESDAAIQ